MARILVTPRSLTSAPPPALNRLREAGHELVFSTPGKLPDEAELLQLVPRCAGWLAGVEPVSDRVIAAATELRVISRNGSGVDSLPLDVLAARGIAVRRADAANADGVAELTVGLMLCALRHLPETIAGVKAGEWPRLAGREIASTTVGVVGCGAIGRRVLRLLDAFGARLLAHDPAAPDLGDLAGVVRYAPLDALFADADIVTLHCPAIPGRPLLGAVELAAMRPSAVLVNTARAGLVDEDALLAALDAGRLSAYAADVFAEEPPLDRRLSAHARVIATSHVGGLTAQSIARATDMAVDNLLDVLGRAP